MLGTKGKGMEDETKDKEEDEYEHCCGAGTFWSEPVQRSGSGSQLRLHQRSNHRHKNLNDILFVSSHIDKGYLKN